MSKQLKARRVVLALTGVVFLAIAIGSTVAPHAMAEPLGYALDNTTALNEFRAVYVGLWLAHVVVFLWAAWRCELLHLGDVAGILLAGQVVGRLASLVLDGVPATTVAPAAIAETVGAVLVFALRPAGSAQASRSGPAEQQRAQA